ARNAARRRVVRQRDAGQGAVRQRASASPPRVRHARPRRRQRRRLLGGRNRRRTARPEEGRSMTVARFSSVTRSSGTDIRPPNVVALAVFLVFFVTGLIAMFAAGSNPLVLITSVIVGLVAMQSPKVAQQWERGVVLRLGRFTGLCGPGLFWIIPFVDS